MADHKNAFNRDVLQSYRASTWIPLHSHQSNGEETWADYDVVNPPPPPCCVTSQRADKALIWHGRNIVGRKILHMHPRTPGRVFLTEIGWWFGSVDWTWSAQRQSYR